MALALESSCSPARSIPRRHMVVASWPMLCVRRFQSGMPFGDAIRHTVLLWFSDMDSDMDMDACLVDSCL